MLMKTRGIVIMVTVFLLAMIIEWKFVAGKGEAETAHKYHGLCNYGIGWPYKDFIHHLRTLSDSGNTNSLSRALHNADDRSMDIFNVWLYDEPEAYSASIHEIFK